MSFAHQFRTHVVPQLEVIAKVEAICVFNNIESWSGAWDKIMDLARNRGALHLSEKQLEELEDWISEVLFIETDAVRVICGQ